MSQASTTANQISYLPTGWVRQRVKITVVVTSLFILAKIYFGFKPLSLFDLQDPRVAVGWAMILTGLCIRSWAAGTLVKTQILATTGPYRMVRHPLYAGSILMIMGYTFLLGHPADFIVTMLLSFICFGLAIQSEEAYLSQKFASTWKQYVASTGAIVPRNLSFNTSDAWSPRQWFKNREYNAWIGSALGLIGLYLWRII
jgi:protein-S-isoprenylcysteine O-methyltransferase Ste14